MRFISKKRSMWLIAAMITTMLSGCDQFSIGDASGVLIQDIGEKIEIFSSTDLAETESPGEVKEASGMHAVKSRDGSETIPVYFGEPVIDLNEGVPVFKDSEKITQMFEIYSGLDELGRCGRAYANVCLETLPMEERGSIGNVRPSGWDHDGKSNNNKYDWVDGNYVFNRCHLIAYSLTGENANEANLITGTRSMNLAMTEYEMMIGDYVRETENHVLYRVTPIFYEDDLIAQGVELEAYSVEDNGEGIGFHVFLYNVEPGVVIDYTTGQNAAAS